MICSFNLSMDKRRAEDELHSLLNDVSGLIDDKAQSDIEVVAFIRQLALDTAQPNSNNLSGNPAKDLSRALLGSLKRLKWICDNKLSPMALELQELKSSIRRKLIICAIASFTSGMFFESCRNDEMPSEENLIQEANK